MGRPPLVAALDSGMRPAAAREISPQTPPRRRRRFCARQYTARALACALPGAGFIKRMTGLTARPSVHPEEAVALGAAVQAGVLDGRVDQTVINPFGHERVTSRLADDPNVFRA